MAKIKLHFNRINMQRGKKSVWTAHTSRACEQSQVIVIRYKGAVVARTVFDPNARQPRAHIAINGKVKRNGRNLYIDVDPDLLGERMYEQDHEN